MKKVLTQPKRLALLLPGHIILSISSDNNAINATVTILREAFRSGD